MFPSVAAVQNPQLFGGVHLSLLGLTILLSVLVVWGARRLRGAPAEDRVIQVAGWVLLVVALAWLGWGLLPANWTIHHSLPLHYSDALRFIAAIALIRRARWAIAITYYWGLTLNLQALLTPHTSQLHVFTADFAFYWWLHIVVFLAPLALVWGLGHRPRWWDFAVAYGAALVWAAVAMTINSMIGTNYGFLNDLPEGPSLLDLLGPWPMYVFWEAVLVAGVWALMTWPWVRRGKSGRRAQQRPRGGVAGSS